MAKIFVLDDEPLIAMMLADWLTEQGHRIVGPAFSEGQAEDLLQGERIDAAILDVSLGDHDCRRIAEALQSSRIPFAFATGHTQDAVLGEFRDVPTLAKPFNFTRVSVVLTELLSCRDGSGAEETDPT